MMATASENTARAVQPVTILLSRPFRVAYVEVKGLSSSESLVGVNGAEAITVIFTPGVAPDHSSRRPGTLISLTDG